MTIQAIWDFINTKPGVASVIAMVGIAVIGGAWALYRHFFPGKEICGSPSTNVAEIVKTLQEGHRQQLKDAVEREETLRGQVRQLTEAVQALADQRVQVDQNAEGIHRCHI